MWSNIQTAAEDAKEEQAGNRKTKCWYSWKEEELIQKLTYSEQIATFVYQK